jgi:hypothetical protein
MFSSEIYHNFQTARKQKPLPAAAGFRTRDLRVTIVNNMYILEWIDISGIPVFV